MKRYILVHSAKGSTWEDHKYVKRIDGTYYYPSGYTKGRTIDSLKEGSKPDENTGPKEESDLSSEDVENLAREVIRGNFANGQERKEALGAYYQKVQARVNELMKSYGSAKLKDTDESVIADGAEVIKKAMEKKTTIKSIDMEQVFSVYRKKGRD